MIPQIWESAGFLFQSQGQYPWMVSHASMPFMTPDPKDPELLRLYFTPRDSHNQSHVALAFVRQQKQGWDVTFHPHPLLCPGLPGSFDEWGAMGSWITISDKTYTLYYIGWAPTDIGPARLSIGIAQSTDGIHFTRPSSKATLEPEGPDEPSLVTTPCVWQEDGKTHMIYAAGQSYPGGKQWPLYDFKQRTWTETGWGPRHPVSDLQGLECALARPSLLKDDTGYHLWYCRSPSTPYRIGYAHSLDGHTWTRHDPHIHLPDPGSWEDQMVCYPHVFSWQGDRWMVYAGNGFGQGGVGLRKLKKP